MIVRIRRLRFPSNDRHQFGQLHFAAVALRQEAERMNALREQSSVFLKCQFDFHVLLFNSGSLRLRSAFRQPCFQSAVERIFHLIIAGLGGVDPIALTRDLGGIAFVDRFAPQGEIISCVDIDACRDDVELQLLALLEQGTVVKVEILAVMPGGLAAGVVPAEGILTCAGDVLKDEDIRRGFEFADFSDQFLHIGDVFFVTSAMGSSLAMKKSFSLSWKLTASGALPPQPSCLPGPLPRVPMLVNFGFPGRFIGSATRLE